jgi:hypothetical protein
MTRKGLPLRRNWPLATTKEDGCEADGCCAGLESAAASRKNEQRSVARLVIIAVT